MRIDIKNSKPSPMEPKSVREVFSQISSRTKGLMNRLIKRDMVTLAALAGLMLAGYSEAASIYSCAGNGERCVVRLENGTIGDQVRILDEKARPIAAGRIVKRRGNFAVISVIDASQTVRKGYPVIVNKDSRSSSLQWAAAFSNHH
jgi:hypothetical protein